MGNKVILTNCSGDMLMFCMSNEFTHTNMGMKNKVNWTNLRPDAGLKSGYARGSIG